jgi:hypothetical protein
MYYWSRNASKINLEEELDMLSVLDLMQNVKN